MSSIALLMPMLGGLSWESFLTIRNMRGPVGETLVTPMVPLSNARNALVRNALRTSHDFFMFLAGDMIYQVDALQNLMETLNTNPSAGVAVGVYHGRGYPYRPLIHESFGKPYIGYPKDAPFRVHAAGLDCSLFRREVFEKNPFPWFRFTEKLSEDLWFAESSRANTELWCDPRVQCGHLSKVVITSKWSTNAKWAVDMLDLDELPLWPVGTEDKDATAVPPVKLVKLED